MAGTILITDSLFVFDEHERQLKAAGYKIDRLDKPSATESELCERIRGKVGYILGGIERVSAPVIAAADQLRVIAFTGSGYSEFIPAYKDAAKRGIVITAASGGNSAAVAEYAITLILMSARKVPLLTNPNSGTSFLTVQGVRQTVLGIIGYGHIGRRVSEMAAALGFQVIVAKDRFKEEPIANVKFASIDDVLAASDIVSLHVSKGRGTNVLSAERLKQLRDGATVVNVAFAEAVDCHALGKELAAKRLFAAFDAGFENASDSFPPGQYVRSNSQTGFNTKEANKKISDMVTASILNVLNGKHDQYAVKIG